MRKHKDIIKIPEVFDDCSLYFAQTPDHIPFKIKRVYYILKSDPQFTRGYHAHKYTDQALFCIQGSIKLILDNGKLRKTLDLNHPGEGVLISKMVWHEMIDFKKDTILLVLTSKVFNPNDYIRDYEKYLKLIHEKQKKNI